MKYVLIFIAAFAFTYADAQSVLPFRGDTIKIYKQGGSAELVLQNKTKDTLGLAVNAGNGLIIFKRSRKIDDSTLVIGYDTVKVGGVSSYFGVGGSTTQITIAGLRALSAPVASQLYQVTDRNREGLFYWDNTDAISSDDSAMTFTQGSGGTKKVYKRITEGVIYPKWFGAVANGATDDAFAINAMFRWLNNNYNSVRKIKKVNFEGKSYAIASTVFLPISLDFSRYDIDGAGATIISTSAIPFFKRVPVDQSAAATIINLMVADIHDFNFIGSQTTGQKAIDVGACYSWSIHNNNFSNLDTAVMGQFMLQCKIENNRYTNNKTNCIWLDYGHWSGGNPSNAASNANLIQLNRFFHPYEGARSGITIIAGNKNIVRDIVSEGYKPRYEFEFDYASSTNVVSNSIENWYSECSSGIITVDTVFKLKMKGAFNIKDVTTIYKGVFFNLSESSVSTLRVDNFQAFETNDTMFVAKNSSLSGIDIQGGSLNFYNLMKNPAYWFGNALPCVIGFSGTSEDGHAIYATQKINFDNGIAVAGGSQFSGIVQNYNTAYFYGLSYFTNDSYWQNGAAIYHQRFGNTSGMQIYSDSSFLSSFNSNYATKYNKWDKYGLQHFGLSNPASDNLTGDFNFYGRAIFTQPSGYSSSFSLASLGDSDFITKRMLLDNGGGGSGGIDGVVTDSTMTGVGTADDTLRVKMSVVAGRKYVDSVFEQLVLSGGADGIGAIGALHDSTLSGSGKAGDSLRVKLTVIAGKKYVDSLFGTLSGGLTDKFPTITGTSTSSPLGNSATKFATEQNIYNAIQAVIVSGGTTLNGWYNILNYGGVADGTFSGTATNNSTAINNAIAAAPDGSIIYIPPGTYYCASTITWPTAKRLFLRADGSLIFRTNSGFIIDCLNRPVLSFNGTIYGTDQSGNPINYGSQTNIGINLRNSRNSEVHVNVITGFKTAIRNGGDGGGNQYNAIYFNNLNRNSVGIEFVATGTTANGPRWANENHVYGGQISGDTGVVFRKDPVNPGDYFNGNTFHDLGFEYAGNGNPMKMAIMGDHGHTNTFFHCRIEPLGVTDAFNFTQDFIGLQMYGMFLQDAWLDHMGAACYLTGTIQGDNGDLLGNVAQGYFYSPTNTYYNERVKIYGTKRTPSGANLLHANIDIEWSAETFVTVSSATYTVAPGIKTVYVNYTGGTSTITLPTAASSGDKPIVIKNTNATNNVNVTGPTTGQTTVLAPNIAATYISNRTAWYDISQKPIGGGGGSSQWDDIATGQIAYSGMVGVGFSAVPGGVLDVAAGNATRPGLIVREGTLTTTPKNGAIEPAGGRWFGTLTGVRREFVMAPYSSVLTPGQTIQVNTGGTGLDYVWPNFVRIFKANAYSSVSSASPASIYGGAITLPHAINANSIMVIKCSGQFIGGGTAYTPTLNIVFGSTSLPINVGGLIASTGLATHSFTLSVRISPTLTSNTVIYEYYFQVEGLGVSQLSTSASATFNPASTTIDIKQQTHASDYQMRTYFSTVDIETAN
jgi:hypothetical protein